MTRSKNNSEYRWRRSRWLCRFLLAAFAVAQVWFAGRTARADDSDLFRGKTITFVVGVGVGGGFDVYTRMLARHMVPLIPGRPSFVVSNMPGAGTLKAVTSLEHAPKDGTYIVAFNSGAIFNSVIGTVKFPFNEVGYLGSLSAETQVCFMWHSTGVKTFAEFVKYPLINVPVTSPNNFNYMISAVMRNMFGANIKPVLGYMSTPDLYLAVARGEGDGGCGTWDSLPKDWTHNTEKKINLVIRLTDNPPPDLPQTPGIMEFADAEQKQILRGVLTISDMFRPYIVSKEVPADRLHVLRNAFLQAVTSKPFLEEAAKTGRTVENPMAGDEVARRVDELYALPAPLKERMKRYIEMK